MNSDTDILLFMDLLDLDEEIVDARLKSIMVKNSHTTTHLRNAIQILKYKHLINLQEGTECENNAECDFLAKLFQNIDAEKTSDMCDITNLTLSLNPNTVVSKSEHLLQQILSNIEMLLQSDMGEEIMGNILIYLKLCDSILNAVSKCGEKISLIFSEVPLENILSASSEKLRMHFLTSTVPKFFDGVIGYNILDRIWNYLKELKTDNKEIVLNVLSCLSDYYLPVSTTNSSKFLSEIIYQEEFWKKILLGLHSDDATCRKISVYLTKRAIDYIISIKINVYIKPGNDIIFVWEHKHEKRLKQAWDNFFVLMDSLEEKQSNIVLPSLQLFKTVKDIGCFWLSCAFNIGLKHDNILVKLKCIEYRLQTRVTNQNDALKLLEAINDINLYDNTQEHNVLEKCLTEALKDNQTFKNILKVIPKVKWSPVPLFHLTNIIATLDFQECTAGVDNKELICVIKDIIKLPCNNVLIREAVHINILHFIQKCCKGLNWHEYLQCYSLFPFMLFKDNLLHNINNDIRLKEDDASQKSVLKILRDYKSIELNLLCLDSYPNYSNQFVNLVTEVINKIQNIVSRQYSDKNECIQDLLFIINLYYATMSRDSPIRESVNMIIAKEIKIIIQYVTSLLVTDTVLCVEDINSLFEKLFSFIVNAENNADFKECLLQLYKTAIMLLNDNTGQINTITISLFTIHSLMENSFLNMYHKQEMLNIDQILKLINDFESRKLPNTENMGRLKNLFYEKSSEVICTLLKENKDHFSLTEIIQFIDNVIECGGYGCLKWVLIIMKKLLPSIINDESLKFNISQFVTRMWKEIDELKSNNQYTPCMKEFIDLITQEALLQKPAYNNILLLYYNKILEQGPMKNVPLFYLIKKIVNMNINSENGLLVYILCEILLYSPVPRKDQRIADNVAIEIFSNPKYKLAAVESYVCFNYEIQYAAVQTLCSIKHPDIFDTITSFITNKIDEVFKNKQRYHSNSQPHRLLMIGLQHILTVLLVNPNAMNTGTLVLWCINMLEKLPHQSSVRVCLEWYIALYIYTKGMNLNKNTLEKLGLNLNNIPLSSQFVIFYWILKHKITNGKYQDDELEFVMDTLLSHAMGQIFNTRLQAQYFAKKLYDISPKKPSKYSYIIEVINKTFEESCQEKNFVKLQNDYFVNDFNLLSNLTPCCIYYFLPRYCDVTYKETVYIDNVKNMIRRIDHCIDEQDGWALKKEWKSCHKDAQCFFDMDLNKTGNNSQVIDNSELTGTIQKKYIPWTNMSDINMYDHVKKTNSSSELIVVASLIDKLPNLGGMARTSEVFGVKTYVVDSLRHLQDKQFQGLSVSAERWVNIEEIRPGPPLKEYLMKKKSEGYSVVAAEQTSTSCKLQHFKFPKKALLLLGHEKEGVPCDLLPLMDYCVEIPQQGFVRSLNVHVTAAIFVWEYVRQNMLQ